MVRTKRPTILPARAIVPDSYSVEPAVSETATSGFVRVRVRFTGSAKDAPAGPKTAAVSRTSAIESFETRQFRMASLPVQELILVVVKIAPRQTLEPTYSDASKSGAGQAGVFPSKGETMSRAPSGIGLS